MQEDDEFFEKLNKAPRIIDYDHELHNLLMNKYVEITDTTKGIICIKPTPMGWVCHKKMQEIIENLTDNDR